MRNLIALILICNLLSIQVNYGQSVNSITIQPSNPTAADTVLLISDLSYYGNCAFGLVDQQISLSDSTINIYLLYCGYWDSTFCNSIDTLSLGVLPTGNHNISIQYHQGSVSPISGFDAIIATVDTSFIVDAVSALEYNEHALNIYPNPASDLLNVQSRVPIRSIEVFDMKGKQVRSSVTVENLDVYSLASGFYFMKIDLTNGETAMKDFIIN